MTTISATSILSSVHALDSSKRLDTLLLRYPRCIHAEFMTHRVFSRNASSSRAIPVEKLIQDVLDDPFVPLYWGKNQKGMQASEECSAPVQITSAEDQGPGQPAWFMERQAAWIACMEDSVEWAKRFATAGYHKQIVNRLLEPFGHITVVVTSSNWSNFLGLRDHKDAEPHIQILAREVRKALEGAEVQTLQPGAWHTPFVSTEEYYAIGPAVSETDKVRCMDAIKKLSVARCASTSYKTVEGFDMTLEVAERIWEKLFTAPIHASPFEHISCMDDLRPERGITNGETTHLFWKRPHLGGNFGPGFIQLRKTLENECL